MSKTALVFAGQGAQSVGMGRDLAAQFPSAQAWFDKANAALGYDLAKICFEGPEADLTKTENAQPGIFLVGWIAFELLKERVPNLAFHATAGLSLGEFTALTAAGAMTFADAIQVVRQRGQFMQEACESTRGGMAAIIGLDEAKTREVCTEAGVELANLNCPGQIVISGAADRMDKACEVAKAKGAKKAVAGRTFRCRAGEWIWTESSHKYDEGGVRAMCARAGLRLDRHWTDEGRLFCVAALRVAT
jgi:[acyl-carrier-protein] S-malonyltransferase